MQSVRLELSELERGITDNSVEVRTLEGISKALRIPLYSFFPGYNPEADKFQIPYYNRRLPDDEKQEQKTERELIEEEILFLNKYIENRKQQLKELKNK